MPYQLRKAEPADIPAVRAVLDDTYRSTWLPQIRPEVAERYERTDELGHYAREMIGKFWVAVDAGQVVAMIHWRKGFVHALHVLGTHRGKGVGRALLELAESQTRAEGIAVMTLETDSFNVPSLTFHQRLGYTETARYPDAEWDSGFTTVRLEKTL